MRKIATFLFLASVCCASPTQCAIWKEGDISFKRGVLFGLYSSSLHYYGKEIAALFVPDRNTISIIDKICDNPENRFMQIIDAAAFARVIETGKTIDSVTWKNARENGYDIYMSTVRKK